MAIRRTIRERMIVAIALPTLGIYVGVLGIALARLHHENRADVESQLTRLAVNYAARFDGAFRELAAVARTTARAMDTRPDADATSIAAQLRANVEHDPVVYGAAMAFEPGTFADGDALFCPYVYRGADGLREMNITRDVYDWYGDLRWQWWHVPKETGAGAWTDPYFDEGAGNVLMVTYSEPFHRDGRFRGVTTVDVMLPTLREQIGQQILDRTDFVILTSTGRFVFNADASAIMSHTIFEVAGRVGRPDIAAAGARIVSGNVGITALAGFERDVPVGWDGWNETHWVAYAPIPSTGWALAVMLPEHDALAAVRSRFTQAAAALALTLALIVACIWYVSGRLARPIVALRAKVIEIGHGDLDARIEGIPPGDEIGDLAASFNAMTAELRANVEHLATERASRERIERDLDLAREIQRGLLPTVMPATPGFEIAGWNLAADKTGGDYFDWLELGDGRTIVTLADVTGHGIGPALIVAVCRAYMRASTSSGASELAAALARVNDLLHEDMPAGRFVTAAVGILDPARDRFELISAGQAPILFYESATEAVHNWDADELPLGIVRGLTFAAPRTITFRSGDVLVLTTDGFMEWPNAAGRQFGSEGLVAFLRAHHALSPSAMIERLHRAVREHGVDVPQADDLTAVVIRKQ